jgi:hypothetical protein
MMMFRDKNNAPIKADSVHVKGSIFTGSGKPFEFEVNKGVCTNCKIQNDMLLFNIVPLLGLGQMQVYTQTFLGDAKAITGTYISENQQKLGVEVVQKGTFLSDRQGAMWVDVYLPIEINDAAQIPWVPAGADEQWIKDYLDKYVKTPAFAATLAALGGASKNLSNVDAKDFEKKAKDGNFAQNDLADVDLAKLKEKGLAAGLADAKNPISPTEFDRMIKQNAAFIALSKTAHPATAGKTNEQIKALFYANRQEVQKGVNLNTDPYNKSTTLLLVYQMSNNQTIQQTLPPVSDNRIIILELIQEPGAANYKAIISPSAGESIDGANTPITVTSNGIAGIFLPIQNENTWDFIPWYKTIDSSLTTSDEQRKELYLGECQAKAYTDVHLRIETNFPNEELLSIGANSCVLIQSVGKDYGVGKALLAFMAFTGYQVKMNNKYYGYNSLNLARTLIFPEPETEINNDVTYMGDNTYLSVKTAAKVSISNNQLIVKDNNKDLPVFSLFKRYNRFDTFVCRGKNYKATVKITDKQNAFVVALMKYTGSENVAPTPELVSYNNDQPQFNAGWSISDKLFISEDAVSGIHEATKTFVVPTDAKEFAVIIFPNASQIPTTMVLNDFEGDITPWFNRMVITDSSHISEKYLEYQKDYAKFVVMTPAGDASYRYTYNKTAGNIPLGIKKGLALVSNNNAWADPGASDPNKVQGDLLAEADGIITIQYSGQAYNETSTINEANFWAAKVAPDGSLTEVPNSRYSTTIEANRKIAKNIQSKSISFPIQQGESVRFLANSNIDDGFYLQSGTDGKPLFEVIINFKEMVGMPFIPDELEKGATEFYE